MEAMRSLLAFAIALALPSALHGPAPDQTRGPGGDCVTINKPNPSATFVIRHQDSSGAITEVTQQWEEITETISRHRVTRGRSTTVHVNRYRIVDDVAELDSMTTATGSSVSGRTTFKPGLVSDPVFRACAGRSWPIPAVSASHEGQGARGTAMTPSGMLRIVAIRESVTVPAGRFDAVRYTRQTRGAAGPTVDECWKSIEHGVIVKHTSKLPAGAVLEELIAIKPGR